MVVPAPQGFKSLSEVFARLSVTQVPSDVSPRNGQKMHKIITNTGELFFVERRMTGRMGCGGREIVRKPLTHPLRPGIYALWHKNFYLKREDRSSIITSFSSVAMRLHIQITRESKAGLPPANGPRLLCGR